MSFSSSRRGLHKIPFEQLKKIAKIVDTSSSDDDTSETESRASTSSSLSTSQVAMVELDTVKVQKNRKRPLEVSSKNPVHPPAFKPLTKKVKARDPRFSELSGKYNPDLFAKSYQFLEQIEQNEKRETVAQLNKPNKPMSEKKRQWLKTKLDRIRSIEQRRRQLGAEQELKRELNQLEKQRIIETGKKPYVVSNAKIKQILRERKYEELKKKGKLNKHLVKARKKQAVKDRRLIPRCDDKDNPK